MVHCGVLNCLTVDMVASALKSANRGSCIIQNRQYNGVTYYVPQIFADYSVLPTDQRIASKKGRGARMNINPQRDYFSSSDDASHILNRVNESLRSYEELISSQAQELKDLQEMPEDNLWRGCKIQPYDANIIVQCSRMDSFIELVSSHSAKCGHALIHTERCTKNGAYVKEVWVCPFCHEELVFKNCGMVKTTVVERERKWSREQAEVNMRIAMGLFCGINMLKILNFMSSILGIKMSNKKNLLHQNKKLRAAVAEVSKNRLDENRREHVALCRETDEYSGDITTELNGQACSIAVGSVSIDGAAATRSYNHRHKSKQCIEVANSSITNKPIALVHYQVSDRQIIL